MNKIKDILIQIKGEKTKVSKDLWSKIGDLPVISQDSDKLISGFVDKEKFSPITDLPLIVFGDHTCVFKYIDFAFVRGADGTQLLKLNEKYDTNFFYYFLQHVKKDIPNIDKYQRHFKYLKEFGISNISFDLPTQQKIAFTLSSLDSKIEISNHINVELEKMSKILYEYWFIQFDFPDKNGKPYKSSGGKMVWNEKLKREIPDGWGVTKMSEWINLDKSGDWGKEKIEGNYSKKVTCIRGADINGLNGLDELKPPTRYILEKNSFKILKSHDLIIEISGGSPTQSTGRLAFITDETIGRFKNPLICSNFCKPISIKNEKLLYNFVYHWNSLYDNGVFFGYEGKTSGIKNLLLDSFISSNYSVVPDDKIVDHFYDIMKNVQKKKQIVLAENTIITELRDWLLPMLMNGQIKIR